MLRAIEIVASKVDKRDCEVVVDSYLRDFAG